MREGFSYGGYFLSEVWEPRKSGLLQLVRTWRTDQDLIAFNGVKNAGIENNEAVYFAGSTQSPSWYILLVDNVSFVGFNAGDTLASHTGWAEFTAYTPAARQQWVPTTPAGRVITGTTSVSFTMSGSGAIKGAGLCSASTGTSGILWSTGAYGTVQSLTAGQVLRTNYTLTGASS